MDENAFRRRTYAAFIALLDNYSAETGTAESFTRTERNEEVTFLDAVMQTKPMQFCHRYCIARDGDKIPEDPDEFKELLHKIWFKLSESFAHTKFCGDRLLQLC